MTDEAKVSASLRGSPMATNEKQPASAELQGAGFTNPAAGVSYAQWRKMGPKRGAQFMARELRLDSERQRKLEIILRQFWKQPPDSANSPHERPPAL